MQLLTLEIYVKSYLALVTTKFTKNDQLRNHQLETTMIRIKALISLSRDLLRRLRHRHHRGQPHHIDQQNMIQSEKWNLMELKKLREWVFPLCKNFSSCEWFLVLGIIGHWESTFQLPRNVEKDKIQSKLNEAKRRIKALVVSKRFS